ncbi:MAG: Ig-like domain-containing protein [Candidatus Hydrogenedentota bacterium]
MVNDNDTFDARIPASGLRTVQEAFYPTSLVNSAGSGRLEVVANRITITPDSQTVAVGSSPNITLKAVDEYGNLDNAINYETGTQGHNVQVQVSCTEVLPPGDSSFSITGTSGMTSVTPTPAATGISSISGRLTSGQGQATIRDTSADTVEVTLSSTLIDSTSLIRFANLITVSAVNLASADSASPDSRAFQVAKFRVVNQSGQNDVVKTVGIRSLNANDAHINAVILYRDDNGNEAIDSGTDLTVATGNFTSGFVTFDNLDALPLDIFDQDSELFMVGYNVSTTVSDAALLDAQVDTVVITSSSANIASTLNSTPNRRTDVKVIKLSLSPTSGTNGTGVSVVASVAAVDTYGNTDIHYNGGTGIIWDLTGSAFWQSATLTAGYTIGPGGGLPDNTQIKGTLQSGQATLTFTDNSAETPILTVQTSPGLTATHDSGTFVFQQGYLGTAIGADNITVNPGDTNIVLLAFNLSANGVSDSPASFSFVWGSSADTRQIRNLRLFTDLDNAGGSTSDDTFSASADTRYAEAVSIVGTTCTFVAVYTNDTKYLASGGNRSYYLVADIADTAIGGDTLDMEIPQAYIATHTQIPNVPLAVRNSAGNCTVARVPDTFRIGTIATSDRQASEDQTEIVSMTLRFSSPSAADRKFYVETVALQVEGLTGGKVPSSVIRRVKLRNQGSGTIYADTTSVPAAGDSIVVKIPFDTANPLAIGGATPETVVIDVVLQIASTVTNNDTFRLRINGFDTNSFRVFDHKTNVLSPKDQKGNVSGLYGAAAPILGSVVTVQKQALVTQQAIRITDPSGNDITYPTSITQGEQFKVELGLRASAGRADAQVKSADTDLTFYRANGITDITNEFTIASRTHSTLTTITAGTVDTITYTVAQGAPFSGANETLVINNYLLSDTGPYLQDYNSNADGVKLRIYAVEDAVSTDAVRIDSTYASVSVVTLAANNIAPDSQGTRIFGFKITDGGPRDTMTGIRVHLATPSLAPMIKSVWIAIDTNKNGSYDSVATGGDTYFGAVQNFLTSDTVFFIDTFRLYGSGDTREFWVCINLETAGITDSVQIRVEIPIDGIGFRGASADQDSIPKTLLTSSVLMRTIIVATRIVGNPDSQTIAVGAGATITITMEDTYGNRNIRTTNYAQATTSCLIRDTWGPIAGGTSYDSKSARWTSTTLTSQSPASLPTPADNYDTLVTGKPTAGIATVTMTDTATETVVIVFSATGISDMRCTVAFNADPNVTAVTLSNLGKVSPDSTDAVILQMDVAYPFTLTTVDSIYLVSENTFDTSIKRLRLWVDSNQNGSFSSATDSNIDTAAWSAGGCSFLVNRNWVKPATISTQRLFVTAEMETSPQNDNDSIGCRIERGGIRLNPPAFPNGFFPPTGELDSINTDTQNQIIDVDATQTNGLLQILHPGQQNKDIPFTLSIRACDKNGNVDRVFTTLGSSSAKDVTFSASPAGFTINSTSMTETVPLPASTMRARFLRGFDTITITPSLADTITLTADVHTQYPADTTITIVVVAGGWSVTAMSLSDGQFVAADSGQVVSRVVFKNLDVSTDTLTRIDVADLGNLICNTDVTNVGLWADKNVNNTFDTGTDTFLGNTTFTATETAVFDIVRPIGSLKAETYFIVVSIAAAPAGSAGDTINIRYVTQTCSTARFGRIPTADVTHTDSVSYSVPSTGNLFAYARSVPDANATSGADNVLVGSFFVRNTRSNADSIQTIVVKNDTGAHPDTGIRVKIFIDGDSDGVYDGVGVDTPFGSAGLFVNRVFSRTDSARIGLSGDTVGFLVLFDLSDTLTVDSQYLRVYIDTGGFTAFVTNGSSDTGESVLLRSSGTVKTNLVGTVFLGESVLVSAGSAAATDTVFVSVAVRDTFGSPLTGRAVTLYAYGSTILTTNPVVTDTQGYAQYAITSATAAVISCTVAIDTGSPPSAKPAATGYANFISLLAVGDTQFTSNTQHATITGVNRKHLTAPSFDSANPNNMAYGYYENSNYRIYGGTFPAAPAAIVSSAGVPGIGLDAPAPTWTSNPKVRYIKGVAGAVVLFGGFSTDTHFGSELYYRQLDGGGVTTRISPNDTRSGTSNLNFDTDAEFDQFDVSPSGETIVCSYTGQLAWWRAVGSAFNPGADSRTFQFVTTLRDSNMSLFGGYGWNGAYIQYPSWSPDGNRIAFTVVYRNNGFAGPSDTAEIFVLYNLGGITTTPIPYQRFGNVTTLPATTNPYLVKVTSADSILFAWQPQWSRDGSALFFSGNNNLNFDYEVFNQTENPHNAIGATGVDFNTYMVYYDKAAETVPYRPILVSHEPSVDEIAGEMSATGESLAIMRAPSPNYEEVRTVRVATQANVTTSGGILFDSGRVSVVIRENESFGNGFTISGHTPDTPTAPGNDSIIISGVAKRFFNPDTPTAPVYFPESVVVYLYYKKQHFTDTDLIGYDGDGDGIPDRTENSIGAYYWNTANWVAYPTVRFPAENKIQFWTDHFSTYAAGLPMEARAMAFGGSVNDVIAYPNPWRADGATAGLASTDERYGIKLTRMPGPDVRVRIYTINGELVNDATVNAANGTSNNSSLRVTAAIVNDGTVGGTVSWNLRNQRNREVASGVFLIVLEGPGGKAVRKVAVMR